MTITIINTITIVTSITVTYANTPYVAFGFRVYHRFSCYDFPARNVLYGFLKNIYS